MASSKIILFTSKTKKDGTHPIALRIIKDRKPKYIFFGKWVHKKDWNEKSCLVKSSHPNSKRLNNFILKKLSEADDSLLEHETKKKNYTVDSVKKSIVGHKDGNSFFDFAYDHIRQMERQKRFTAAAPEKSRIDNLKLFFGQENPSFAEVNVASINKFQIYLSEKGKSQRYIMNHLITIRTVFNKAINEGVIEKGLYPFSGNNIKIKRINTVKIGLEKEELKAIIDLEYPIDSPQWHARNVYLISFYFAGARIADVLKLKWSDFSNDRLIYQMGKNKKSVSIKVPEQAGEILEEYKIHQNSFDDYVFPFLKGADHTNGKKFKNRIGTITKLLNQNLKKIALDAGITKKLTNHIARHTFGNLAGNKIPIPMLQKLYRHSSMLTTAAYQGNFMHKDTDEALDAVVNI